MPFKIIRQDITKMNVDAIVNAANTALQMGGGVCGAIFRAAGVEQMQAACAKAAPIQTGEAAITPGFALPAKFVIHAAGPVFTPLKRRQCRELLRSAYLESLKLAEENGCKSIAFPLISSGIYGYPKDEALEAARFAIEEYLADHEIEVYLVVYDKAAFILSSALLGDVETYIDEHYAETHRYDRRRLLDVEKTALQEAVESNPRAPLPTAAKTPMTQRGLDDLMENLEEPFSDTLLKFIDKKGKTDVEVYKKANIDRKLFSKIRTGKGYTPKKTTILALAVALELTLDETDELLGRAGYALSHARKFDVIVEFFLVNGKYNIYEINEVLFQYDQPLLGS
ncbi:MAG: macro domain-containing protein [Eubacteriales bacterium]|nr:macro domain-containing protein [Eubacteriales bacterium]